MSAIQVIQLCIYDILGVVPCLVLAILPLKDYQRFSLRTTVLILSAVVLLAASCRVLSQFNLNYATTFSLIKAVLYAGFYKLCICSQLEKLLFVLFLLLNYGCFLAILIGFTSRVLIGELYFKNPYSFHVSLITIVMVAVSFPPMYWMMGKKVYPLMKFSDIEKQWKYMWMVPAVFCISYYYNLSVNGGILYFASNWRNLLYSTMMNFGSLFVTYIVISLIKESNDNYKLKTENHQLAMQTFQYENLNKQIENTRRARHDLRHSIAVIQNYLDNDNKKGLKEYLNQYLKTQPVDSPVIYCKNHVLNTVIVYYAYMAEKENIKFNADIQYPQVSPVLDVDITVLFGNLLENAVEGCSRQTVGSRFINISARCIESVIVFVIDNSYDGLVKRKGDTYLSSKENRVGIGLTSVQKLAEKYHGVVKYEYDESVFQVSLMLSPDID